MTCDSNSLYGLTAAVRRTFQALQERSNVLMADQGLTASMRSVLEILDAGAMTVPDMARERRVSRQHIQVNVDRLLGLGLVQRVQNPSSRKSPLIERTLEGAACFQAIRKAEDAVLEALCPQFSQSDVACAQAVLQRLTKAL